MRLRVWPPIEPKEPPTYTVEPETARALTLPFAFGFQLVASPVVVSIAPIRLRLTPPADVNWPPAYAVDPATPSVRTAPPACGFQLVRAAVAASTAAIE